MLFRKTITSLPFMSWILQEKENNRLILLTAIIMGILFTWLKILYPYPNFMPPDSNSYLEAAYNNQFINIWAIGYSKFLRLVSSITSSHFVLVLLQYVLLQASVLYFLFSIRYLLSPGKWTFRTLLVFTISNPLLVHISNFVSTDAVFTALSVIWFTQLLWIIYKPSWNLLLWHAIIILLAFMVRYNALYYPFVSIIVVSLIRWNIRRKIAGICSIVLPLLIFVGQTQYEYHSKTGTVQYSAFGGWQIAANALYGYAYAKQDRPEDIPMKFYTFHKLVNRHMDSLKHIPPFLRPDNEVAVYYLWDFKSPLRSYMNDVYKKDTSKAYFERWASIAPFYAAYGRFLISRHPKEFLRHYVWPNFIKYYAPPTKFMGVYNTENKTVDPIVTAWFRWKDNKLPTFFNDRKINITEVFPIVFAVINIAFLLGFIAFWILGGFRTSSAQNRKILVIIMSVWFSNMVFSVLAAPIELRYQLFPMVITSGFAWLFISFVVGQTQIKSNVIPSQDSSAHSWPALRI